ncbi:MAG: 6-phospho-beta-glucosidase, partial [Armatimonadetes bacterium]|nr:6-phospho-beta-glucosidase [Armatimonadota bacterium]
SLREVWLVDIEAGRKKLEIVGGLAERMVERQGNPFALHLSTDRREALPGATYVVTQIRVGGIQARILDERIPLRHDVIGQETTGPGGFAKALRTIPVILDICRDLEELAPQAWLVNFANPSGIVTEAASRHTRTRFVGLCNNAINMERWFAREFGATPEEVSVEYAGCNHLLWANRVRVRGTDVTEELLKRVAAEGEWPQGLIESLRAIPCSYHRYYYMPDEMLAKAKKAKKTRGEEILALEKELFDLYRDPDLAEKPEALSKRGGALYSEAACRLISSIHTHRRDVQCVNTTNRAALSDLAPDSVVEVSCVIGRDGPTPLTVGPLRPELRGLLQQVKAYEELTVRAAVTGDRGAALQALIANPLVPSAGVAKSLLDDLLEAHAAHLPQFARTGRRPAKKRAAKKTAKKKARTKRR